MTDRRRNPPEQTLDEEDDVLTDDTEDAILDMEAHEGRRDGKYNTGGDDQSPGIDTDMDANAPKDQELPLKKRGGSRGKSDWR
jgi:hypothetical protein